MSETTTVRTTFQPEVDVEVGAVEYADLKRQGLLVETQPVADRKPTERNAVTEGK